MIIENFNYAKDEFYKKFGSLPPQVTKMLKKDKKLKHMIDDDLKYVFKKVQEVKDDINKEEAKKKKEMNKKIHEI